MAVPPQAERAQRQKIEPRAAPGTQPDLLRAGIAAGALGGLFFAIWSSVHAAAIGAGVWAPWNQVAAAVFGVDALLGGPIVYAVGLALHFATASVLGVIFAGGIGSDTAWGVAFFCGLVYGAIVYFVNTYYALPTVDPVMAARIALDPTAFLIGHLLYGVGVSATPLLRRRR